MDWYSKLIMDTKEKNVSYLYNSLRSAILTVLRLGLLPEHEIDRLEMENGIKFG